MNRSTPGLPVHHQLPEFSSVNINLLITQKPCEIFIIIINQFYMRGHRKIETLLQDHTAERWPSWTLSWESLNLERAPQPPALLSPPSVCSSPTSYPVVSIKHRQDQKASSNKHGGNFKTL